MKKIAFAVIPSAILCMTSFAAAQPAPAPAPPAIAAPEPVIHDPAAVPAGTYVLDQLHTGLTGTVKHGGLANFPFRFRRYDAKFTYDPAKPDTPSIEVSIDPGSIDTNVPGFDSFLAISDRYFNISKYPEIKFTANSLKRTGPDKGVMEGTLTFMGKTQPLNLDVTFLGVKKTRDTYTVGFAATATILRSDFGIGIGSPSLVDEIKMTVDGDFVRQ